MKITEGIVWDKKDGEWVKTLDNWPVNRRGARIVVDDGDPFGQYGKNEAIDLIEGWIEKGPLRPNRYRLAMIPGKEMSQESKGKLKEFTNRKKVERGEVSPAESYVSED